MFRIAWKIIAGLATRHRSAGDDRRIPILHWFTHILDTPPFLFNIHVNDTNPENPNPPGRVYVDPMGEKIAGGLIKASKITYGKVNPMYG